MLMGGGDTVCGTVMPTYPPPPPPSLEVKVTSHCDNTIIYV